MAATVFDPGVTADVLDATDVAKAAAPLDNTLGQFLSNVAKPAAMRFALEDISNAIVPNAPTATRPSNSIRLRAIVRRGDEHDLTVRVGVSANATSHLAGAASKCSAQNAQFLPQSSLGGGLGRRSLGRRASKEGYFQMGTPLPPTKPTTRPRPRAKSCASQARWLSGAVLGNHGKPCGPVQSWSVQS